MRKRDHRTSDLRRRQGTRNVKQSFLIVCEGLRTEPDYFNAFRMTAATDIYAKQWKELAVLTIVSIFFVHLMTVAAFSCIMAGLGITVPVLTLVTAVTIGNIAGLIPLCPGGIGGRDVVIITILAAGGVAIGDAKTGQLLYTATVLFFNLLGGVFFLFDPGRKTTEETLKKELEASNG